MIKQRLESLDPELFKQLKRTSRRFRMLKARLQDRLRELGEPQQAPRPGRKAGGHEIVVASYNIHKCVGTDGRFDPARIINVISELGADVVAIQEADERFGRRRGLLDLSSLERQTGLTLVPTSVQVDGHGWHGNALFLKRGGVAGMRRLNLPGGEPRGALVVDLELPAGPLRLVAAHLGLLKRSRQWQLRSIMGAIEEGPRMPTLILGDLNEWRPGRRSSLQALGPAFGPVTTGISSFPSYFPVVALDRAIGSPGLIASIDVHQSPLAQVASDHLPLRAHIDIQAAERLMQRDKAA